MAKQKLLVYVPPAVCVLTMALWLIGIPQHWPSEYIFPAGLTLNCALGIWWRRLRAAARNDAREQQLPGYPTVPAGFPPLPSGWRPSVALPPSGPGAQTLNGLGDQPG